MSLVDLIAVAAGLSVLVLGLAAAIAGVYVWHAYQHRAGESDEFRRLVMRDVRVAAAGLLLALIVAYLLLRWAGLPLPAIPSPWTTVALALVLDVALWGVVADALAFRRLRRTGRMGVPDADG